MGVLHLQVNSLQLWKKLYSVVLIFRGILQRSKQIFEEDVSKATFFKLSPSFNPSSINPTKWSDTLKQSVSKLIANCLNVFDHFVILAVKVLRGPLPLSKSILT